MIRIYVDKISYYEANFKQILTMQKTELELIFGTKSKNQGNKIFLRNEDLEVPHGEDYKLAIELLKKIETSELMGKVTPNLFTYNDVSLWWFIYQSLIPELKKSINFVQKLLDYVDDVYPYKITVEDFENFDLIQQICSLKNIKLDYSTSSYNKFKIKKSLKIRLKKYRNDNITKTKIKTRKEFFLKNKKTLPNINNKFIFAISTNFRRFILDYKTGKSIRGEYIQQTIIDMFPKESIGIDLDYTFRGEHNVLEERITESIPWFPLEVILYNKENIQTQKKFLKNYNGIISNKQFQELFYFKQISLWSQLTDIFEEMKHASYLPFYIQLLDSLKTFLEKHKPKAIFLPYETGPLALAFIVEAEKLGIKTIGIQHGYIYEYNPMYSFDNFRTVDNPYGFPIPNYTLIFGQAVKNLLIEIGYPEKKLIVFGNPAFFNISQLKEILSQNSLFEKYNLDSHKKIILFTTGKLQPYYSHHGNYDYDVQVWKHLLEKFSSNPDYVIILKPHPQEYNVEIYEDLLKKFPNVNAKIIPGNLYELIYLSSITISIFSSTMLDSLCFDKPVIRVRFQDDFNPIFDDSGAITTIDLPNLSSTIKKIFLSDEIMNSLLLHRKQFVKDQYGLPEENPQLLLKNIIDDG